MNFHFQAWGILRNLLGGSPRSLNDVLPLTTAMEVGSWQNLPQEGHFHGGLQFQLIGIYLISGDLICLIMF